MKRGRPKSPNRMEARILVRLDSKTLASLGEHARRTGVGAESTAARIIIVEKLRKEGLL